jgi:L-methionine (R)-S-oxide reductase
VEDVVFQAGALEGSKVEQYAELANQARGLLSGERDRIANAANLSALVFHALSDLNWVGFYFYDGRELVVGPFQGRPACVRIALGRGVCGTAATSRQTQRVADVDAFAGHIPCDSASRSELVVPLFHGEQLIGVFDLDSPNLDRFDAGLRQTGVRTLDDLKEVGALAAFVRVKRAGFKPSLNLLYSLEGAILDCHWQEIPEERRSELILSADEAVALLPQAKHRRMPTAAPVTTTMIESDEAPDPESD